MNTPEPRNDRPENAYENFRMNGVLPETEADWREFHEYTRDDRYEVPKAER